MRPVLFLTLSVFLVACSPGDKAPPETSETASPTADIPPEMTAQSPAPGAEVTSPLNLTGSTPGTWYFEGSFPIELIAEDGRVLVEHYASADGNWMTEEQVAFQAQLSFEVETPTRATLILREDDPSGQQDVDEAQIGLTLLPGD